MSESPYDAFGGGHASVSISAAFGMAKAAEMRGERHQAVSYTHLKYGEPDFVVLNASKAKVKNYKKLGLNLSLIHI